MSSYYGVNLLKVAPGGLGAAIHVVMLALHYAKRNNLELVLVEGGTRYPSINGYGNKLEKGWHSYFSSLKILPESKITAVWPDCPSGWDNNPPEGENRINWYSQLLREIFLLTPEIKREIIQRVLKSGFNPSTDVVLHIRRTDKIFPNKGSVIEAGELPLEEYVESTVEIIQSLNRKDIRVFLCTDDKKIYPECTQLFSKHAIPVIWDSSEDERPLQAMRLSGNLKSEEAWEDNLTAFKVIWIMSRGLYLIGGRASYLFRIGELLRYPLPTKNIKDCDKFGRAPYAEPNEPLANPMNLRRYTSFVSDEYINKSMEEWKLLQSKLDQDYIITLPNFINFDTGEEVYEDIFRFKEEWWNHAIRPSADGGMIHIKSHDPNLKKHVLAAEKESDRGYFAYHFKRSIKHYDTCICFACRLHATMESYEVRHILSKLVGTEIKSLGETFASKYERDDFLNLHHDKDKGSYTFILSLTKNWNPVHGGNTHFYDETTKSIYRTLSPEFGALTIFKLSPERRMDHFVSRVCGPNKRYTFTGWFNV